MLLETGSPEAWEPLQPGLLQVLRQEDYSNVQADGGCCCQKTDVFLIAILLEQAMLNGTNFEGGGGWINTGGQGQIRVVMRRRSWNGTVGLCSLISSTWLFASSTCHIDLLMSQPQTSAGEFLACALSTGLQFCNGILISQFCWCESQNLSRSSVALTLQSQ